MAPPKKSTSTSTKKEEVDISQISDVTESYDLEMVQEYINGESNDKIGELEFKNVKSSVVKKMIHQTESSVNLYKSENKDKLKNAAGSVLMTVNHFGKYNYYSFDGNWFANNGIKTNLSDEFSKLVKKNNIKFIFTGEIDNKMRLKKSSKDLENKIGEYFHCHHYISQKTESNYVYMGPLKLVSFDDKEVEINNIEVTCRFYYFGN